MASGTPPPSTGGTRRPKPADRVRRPHDVDLVATRIHDERPERWVLHVTIGGRRIDVGSFPSLGKAIMTGARVYFESTLPPPLRRKYRHLFED